MEIEFGFKDFPVWRGVQTEPGVKYSLPYSIGWDSRGYISQKSDQSVREQMVNAYSDEDYSCITSPPGTSKWANSLGQRSIDQTKKFAGPLDGKTILEVGAGSDYIANSLTDAYKIYKYFIMDPSIKNTSSKDNIEIHREYFQVEKCLDVAFELVLAFGILEHLADPMQFLLDLNRVLTPTKGRAIMCFPDTERQLRAGDLSVLVHEHLSYFTEKTVKDLFYRCGFRVLECETIADSFYYYLEAVGEIHPKKDIAMDDVLADATNQYYYNLEWVQKKIHSLLERGETLAFHGACNGLNNLLYLFGLNDNENILVFDGDDTKVGHYLPTCLSVVRASDDPTYQEVDRVFIAATSFYQEIKQFLMEQHHMDEDRIVSVAKV